MARLRSSWSAALLLLLTGTAHGQTEVTFKSFGTGVEWCDGSTFGGGFQFTTPATNPLPLSYSGLTPCDPAYGTATTTGTLSVSATTLTGRLDSQGGFFSLDDPMTLTIDLNVRWPVPPSCIRSGVDCSNANLFVQSGSINQGTSTDTCQPKSASQATIVSGQTVDLRVTLSCRVSALTRRDDEPKGFVTLFEYGFRFQKGLSVVYPLHVYGLAVYDLPAAGSVNVTEISPSVAVNTPPPDFREPLTALISGRGFAQGAKVSMGDVRVLATRFRSATQLEVDLGGFEGLPEGPRSVTVTNSDGGKGDGKDLFFVSSLVLGQLEVNQAVASECSDSQPCLSDHRTVMRQRVACRDAACERGKESTTGLLHVYRAGTTVPIPGSPFLAEPSGGFPVMAASTSFTIEDQDRAFHARDSLNFYFTTRLLGDGDYDAVFEVNPRNPSEAPPRSSQPDTRRHLTRGAGPFRFRTGPPARRIALLVDGNDHTEFQTVLRSLEFVRSTYPATRDRLVFVPVSSTLGYSIVGALSEEYLDGYGIWRTTMRLRQFYWGQLGIYSFVPFTSDPFDHILFFTSSDYLLDRGATDAGPTSTGGWQVISPTSMVSLNAKVLEVRSVEEILPKTIAHELGHQLGLGDTYPGTIALRSPNNPPDGCQKGCDVETGSFDTLRREVSVLPPSSRAGDRHTVKYDFMGDQLVSKSWVDARTFSFLRAALSVAPRRPLADGDWLFVSGFVKADGTGGAFGPAVRYSGASLDSDTSEGAYTLELQNASGQPVSSARIAPSFTAGHDRRPLALGSFARSLAFASGARRLSVKAPDGRELASRTLSANAPVVRVTSPRSGDTLSGAATISWTASDPDGDALTFSVAVSADGQSWTPIASDLTGTSLAWSSRLTPGTTSGKVMVVASDGYNQSSAVSEGTFTVRSQGPLVAITSPANGAVFEPGQAVALEGTGLELSGGDVAEPGLSFVSSRDGNLGTGSRIVTSALSRGTHTITLTGTGRDGVTSTDSITVTVFDPASATPSGSAFVPIVLSNAGVAGSFFTSEMTLTNRGTTDAVAELRYTSAFGGGAPPPAPPGDRGVGSAELAAAALGSGSGVGYAALPPGRQVIVPDTIAYLRSLGVPIPDGGNQGGSIRVRFFGLSSPTAGSATIRTTTAVAQGRAGLSYPAVLPGSLTGAVTLCGLRQTATDRSNLALMNAGDDADGNVTLRVTVYSGDPSAPLSVALPDVTLAPGAFTQISQVLASNGLSLTNGYARVERVSGTAPYYAFAVINDQANSDGSFVPPSLVSSLAGKTGITLPVAVEAGPFTTELVLTNFGTVERTIRLTFVADAIAASGNEASVEVTLRAGEQRVIPSFVAFLRQQGAAGVGSGSFAGPVFLSVSSGDVSGLFIGARTSSPGGGGRYGLFYPGVPYGNAATSAAWLYGLQQDAENRTNVAIVNTGEADGGPDAFKIELYDGATGQLANVVDVTVGARRFTQLTGILKTYAPAVSTAYARVVRTAGGNPFVTYAVINDGGGPGERSDDGAFVAMDAEGPAPAAPRLEAAPLSIDFGTVTVGQTKDASVTVRNAGGGTLTGTAQVGGAGFTLTSSASFVVGAGLSQTLTVRFAPAFEGASNGLVALNSDGGSATVALTGGGATVAAPRLEVDTASLDFGSVTVGSTRDLSLSLRNAGNAPLTVSSITAGAPFSVVSAASLTLGAGTSQNVTVRFAPTAVAGYGATLSIQSNDPARPTTAIALGGQGTPIQQATTEELLTDDGTVETGIVQNGLVVVNRLTPTRYPATLRSIRVHFVPFQGFPTPSGAQIRLAVFTDPSGLGRPPAGAQLLTTALLTIPSIPAGGSFVEWTIDGGPSIPSGDFYVGYIAPNPAGGVIFSADTNGPQRNRGWYSTDSGVSFQGPLGVQNQQGGVTPANILVRATVSIPAAAAFGEGAPPPAPPGARGGGSADLAASFGEGAPPPAPPGARGGGSADLAAAAPESTSGTDGVLRARLREE